MSDLLRRLLRTPQGALGIAILAVLALTCLLGPDLAPVDPEKINFLGRFKPPGGQFWLGADQLGRDMLSRILVGARTTLPIALAATLLGTLSGAVIGTLS
ncbi:MAG TPA: ABC transporter permease, partial [Stellaceae bacterium]|nr:ABC transporter permease [Stellaceae bacterium]